MNLVISALARGWRDGLVVCLALLVNLVEQSDECCQQLEDLEVRPRRFYRVALECSLKLDGVCS